MDQKTIEFTYDRSTRRPKRLENHAFVLYSPQRIRIQPGEIEKIDMKLKIILLKSVVGSCRLLKTFEENGIKLLNSSYISQRSNNDLLILYILALEVLNKNMNNIFQLKKKQELGFFILDGWEEIRHHIRKNIKKYY